MSSINQSKYNCPLEYPQVPPKVEYSTSKKGKTLIPLLELMHSWAIENIED